MGHPLQQDWHAYMAQAYPEPVLRRGSASLAILSALVGLGVAGALAVQTTLLLTDLLESWDSLVTGWKVMLIGQLAVAGLVLIGAVLVFARRVAGAFVLMAGAVLAVAALVVAPVIAEVLWVSMIDSRSAGFEPSGDFVDYFKAMIEFGNEQAVLRFVALALGVLLLITAMLPPSLKWLRRPRHDDYSEQQAGW